MGQSSVLLDGRPTPPVVQDVINLGVRLDGLTANRTRRIGRVQVSFELEAKGALLTRRDRNNGR